MKKYQGPGETFLRVLYAVALLAMMLIAVASDYRLGIGPTGLIFERNSVVSESNN